MKNKKNLIIIFYMLVFSFLFYGEEISVKVKAGKNSYKYDQYCKEKETIIKPGTIFDIKGFMVGFYQEPDYSEVNQDNYVLYLFSKGNPALRTEDEYLSIEGIIPNNTKTLFPEKYLSFGTSSSEKVYINIDCLDAFYKKDKQIAKHSGLNKNFEDLDYFYIGEYLRGNMENYPIFSNVVLTFFTLENFLINNISKNDESTYFIDCIYGGDRNDSYEQDYDCHPIWLFERFYDFRNKSKGDNLKIKVVFDGDYVRFYDTDQNRLLVTHVLVDKQTALICADFFQDKKNDLSKVTWPRHADGSCDYDGSKSSAKTASANQPAPSTSSAPTTNVSVKKLMTTNCNLKLRAAEATSSNVFTVME